MPKPRILVVEDVWMIAASLTADLERIGYEVVGPACCCDEGFFLLKAGALDGAVLDINLNGEEVFPLADALALREVPYIFLTGYDELSQLPERFHGRPRLHKPYQMRALKTAICDLVQSSGHAAG